MYSERMPPHDIDAEQAVLGSLLIDPEAIFKVVAVVNAGDFFLEKHSRTYQACLALYDRNEGINPITVGYELGRRGQLEAIGGSAFLSDLVLRTPTSVGVEYYAHIVSRLGTMRDLISAANDIASIGY